MTSGRAQTLAIGFLVCSLVNLFSSIMKISTSELPFHNPLVMKCNNIFSIFFSLDYENCPFIEIQLVDNFAHKLYLSNTHKLQGP